MTRDALLLRDRYRWWQSIVTRWSDNDAYGHVNNAVYYHWFDTAVNNWLIDVGLLDIANGDPIGLVVGSSCRYASSITYPEPVEIGLAVGRLGNSSVTYQLGAFLPGMNEPAAQGTFTHVYVQRNSRRPVSIPPKWRALLEGLIT